MSDPIFNDETKATSQHQITIPKKIWDKLSLKAGMRFQVLLTQDHDIVVRPKISDLQLDEAEWRELCRLAKSKKNIGRKFSNSKDAMDYLDRL